MKRNLFIKSKYSDNEYLKNIWRILITVASYYNVSVFYILYQPQVSFHNLGDVFWKYIEISWHHYDSVMNIFSENFNEFGSKAWHSRS